MNLGLSLAITAVRSPDLLTPTLLSAVIGTSGGTLTLTFSEAVTGTSGFTLTSNDGNPTLSYASGAGTAVLVYTLSRAVYDAETPLLVYTPGNVTDLVGNALVAFAAWSVTNHSEQTPAAPGDATAPTIQSATIGSDGQTLTIVLSEAVNGHSGFTLTPSGGAAGLTYSSGDGTNTEVYAIDRTIYDTETVTGDYAPGDVEDGAGNALATTSDFAVTNDSAQTWTPPASCVLWLESDYGLYQERSSPSTPASANNDSIGTADDHSASANHFTAASDGDRPYLDTSGAFPVIQFDGTDDKLTAGSSVTVKHWIIVCMYHAAAFDGFDGLLTGVTSGAEQIVLIGYDGATRWYDDVGTVLNGATYTLNGTSYAQGNRQAPMNAQGLISVSDNTGWTITPQLGDDRDIAGRHWSGCLTALFGFSAVLSAEDLASVVAYLNNKYSIY